MWFYQVNHMTQGVSLANKLGGMNWLKNAKDLNSTNSFLEYNNIIELKSKMVGLN